jgi:hypothetical protein
LTDILIYDLPTYDLPTYDLSTYDLPTYDLRPPIDEGKLYIALWSILGGQEWKQAQAMGGGYVGAVQTKATLDSQADSDSRTSPTKPISLFQLCEKFSESSILLPNW